MASDKQRRKASRKAKKKPQTGPFRHPDGDRRHRIDTKQAYFDKSLLRLIGAVELPREEDGEEEARSS